MSITRINEFLAAEEKADELFDFLKSLIPYITSSEGCLACEVLQNEKQQTKFLVIEKWISVDHHQKSIENFPKEEMQAAMHFFAAPPQGSYYHA
ncbi:MAG: antibiotic biosynthesis monooxygenase [Deferribacteres bacterium]|nr:antibiotic biosynthesis monooxygenase [candidate division KSB1 bacterium]MCB9502216.1 antibiotic biosynthesis monooxygenase [Deferribacteres bacterium]